MSSPDEGQTYAEKALADYITAEASPNPAFLPITRDTKLIELGILDSLSILKLVGFLEEKFGTKVDPEDVVSENFETIAAITAYVSKKRGGS